MAVHFLQNSFTQLLELETPALDPVKLTCALAILLIAVDTSQLGIVVALLASGYLGLHAYHRYLDVTMEKTAKEALVTLKSSSHSIDAKVTQLTKLKSEIKQRNVPDVALSTVFTATRSAISSPQSALSTQGYATLSNLLKRLYLQEHYQTIASNGRNFYSLLVERLGDHKEPIRSQAAQAFTDFWSAAPAEVEHQVLETALVGKNTKAREASINWLLIMTQEHGLLYRTYVPRLIGCLEDADSGVREAAKRAVVEIFSNGPARAKSDLKRELQVQNVRKSIVTSIMTAIDLNQTADAEANSSHPQGASSDENPEVYHDPEPEVPGPRADLQIYAPSIPTSETVTHTSTGTSESTPPTSVEGLGISDSDHRPSPSMHRIEPSSTESNSTEPTNLISTESIITDESPPTSESCTEPRIAGGGPNPTSVGGPGTSINDGEPNPIEPNSTESNSTQNNSQTNSQTKSTETALSSGHSAAPEECPGPRVAGSDPTPTSVGEMGTSSNGGGPLSSELSRSEPAKTVGDPQQAPRDRKLLLETKPAEQKTLDSPDGEDIEPKYVDSRGELESTFRDMAPHFEGKEVESNWVGREKCILTIRRLVRGNAPHDYSHNFIGGIKSLLDGILKTVSSLRTTVCTSGCYLIHDLAKACGSGLDPMVDIIMQTLIKLCGGSKKISAQKGNVTVEAVISNVTYSSRILQHIWQACQDKNIQPRIFASSWLKTIINRQSRIKSSIDHGGGLDTVEKAIKKGLADSNPGAREGMRSTYWTFAKFWPQKAESIMSSLDAKSKGLLEKNQDNPDFESATKQQNPMAQQSITELKAMIDDCKKKSGLFPKDEVESSVKKPTQATSAKVKPAGPARPKSVKEPTQATSAEVKSTGPARPKSVASSLSSAPMRPAARTRKPEITRPATADPYSARQAAILGTKSRPVISGTKSKPASPVTSPRKTKTKIENQKLGSPARPKLRMGLGSTSIASTTSMASMTNKPKRLEIPRTRPKEPKLAPDAVKPAENPSDDVTSHTKADEDTSAVAPPEDIETPLEEELLQEAPSVKVTYPSSSLPETVVIHRPENPSNMLEVAAEGSELGSERSLSQKAPTSLDELECVDQWKDVCNPPQDTGKNLPFSVIGSSEYSDTSSLPDVVTEESDLDPQQGELSQFLNLESHIIPPQNIFNIPQGGFPQFQQSALQSSVSIQDIYNAQQGGTPQTGHTGFQDSVPSHNYLAFPQGGFSQASDSGLYGVSNMALPVSVPTYEEPTQIPMVPDTSNELTPRPHEKRQIPPQPSADITKTREMIAKGVSRIRAKAVDAFGFRKLRNLTSNSQVFVSDDALFDSLLLALLDELESDPVFLESDYAASVIDVKIQIMVLLRHLLEEYKDNCLAYYAPIVTSLIATRRHYMVKNSTMYLISLLEDLSMDIAEVCNPIEVMDAVLNYIEADMAPIFGTSILTSLLARFNPRSGSHTLQSDEIKRLADYARRWLADDNVDVRRVIFTFCAQLHSVIGAQDKFWQLVSSPDDSQSLLYYLIERM